jgi:hypothetical protein
VVKHIRRLGRERARGRRLHRLDQRLDRFFAEFLGAFFRALCQQFGGPAAVGVGGAGGDDARQLVQKGHAPSRTGMPAAAICALASAMVIVAEVEDRGGQHGRGAAFRHAFDEVIERADPARGDHGDVHRVGNGAGQRQVEARARAVAIHRGEQDLARALCDQLRANSTASMPGGLAPAMGEDLPLAGPPVLASIATTMHWLPNWSAASAHHVRVGHGGGVEADLVGARQQQRAHILGVRTPPPTVSGMKHCSAVRRTTSNMVPRFSWVAWMSRKHSSSAPAAS